MMNRGEKQMAAFALPAKAAGFSSDGVGGFRSQLNAGPVCRAWSSLGGALRDAVCQEEAWKVTEVKLEHGDGLWLAET